MHKVGRKDTQTCIIMARLMCVNISLYNQFQVQLLSRNALQFFPTEDSAHYLIYSLLFYNQPPTTS